MMLDLLRRDHVVRTLYWGLPLGALVGVMAWRMSALAQAGPVAATELGRYLSHPDVARELSRYLLLAAWVALAFPLIVPTIHRCSRLDLTLPISPRRLWLGHNLALLLSGLTVLLTAATVAATALWWQGVAFTDLADLLGTGLRLVGLLALAHAILQSPKPGLYRIPFSTSYVLGVIVVMGGITLLLAQAEIHTSIPVIALLVAVALYARTYRALPEAFTLLPREAGRERPPAEPVRMVLMIVLLCLPLLLIVLSGLTAGLKYLLLVLLGAVVALSWRPLLQFLALGPDRSGPHGVSVAPAMASLAPRTRPRGRLWLAATLLRSLTLWVGLPYSLLFLGFGALLSGHALSEDMRTFGAMNLAFMLWNWVLLSVARLRVLDPLPVSRRRLFALVLAPALVVSGFGYGVTELIGRHSPNDQPLVGLGRNRSGYYVHVPARFLEIAWTGATPAVSAPWGESYPAWRGPLARGLPPAIYSPFHAPQESSLDFVALQLSRGIQTVYGREIPLEEIRDRYLKLDAGGSFAPRNTEFRLLQDYPGLAAAPPRGRTLATLLFVGVPLLLSLAFVLRVFRAVVPGTDARRFNMALGPCFIVLAIGYLAVNIARISQPWIVSGFMDILGRQVATSGWSLHLLAWAATLASGTLSYRMARREYELIQAPVYRDPKQDFLHQLGLGS